MQIDKYLCSFKEYLLNKDYVKCLSLCNECVEPKARNILQRRLICGKSYSEKILDKCHTWCGWAVNQNAAVTKILMKLLKNECNDESHILASIFYEKVVEMQGIPVTEPHISIELVCLNNYLVSQLFFHLSTFHEWSDEIWPLIYQGLSRVVNVTSKTENKTENLFCLSSDVSILLQSITFSGLNQLSFEALCYFCCTFSWLVALEKNFPALRTTLETFKILSKTPIIHQRNKENNVNLCIISPSDSSMYPYTIRATVDNMHMLLKSCLKIKNCQYSDAVDCLDKIRNAAWIHFVLYIKGFLHYNTFNYNAAITACMKIYNERLKVDENLCVMACNLIGCCFFSQENYQESQKWFTIAEKLNSCSLLPLFNLSLSYNKEKKMAFSMKALNTLVEKSSDVNVSYTCLIFDSLVIKYEPEMNKIETLYLCGHQYLTLKCFHKASQIFMRLIPYFQNHQFQLFAHQKKESVSAYRVYIEAAYSYLHANDLEECIEVCDLIERLDPSNYYMHTSNILPNYQEPSNSSYFSDNTVSKCHQNFFQKQQIFSVIDTNSLENKFYSCVRMLVLSSVHFTQCEYELGLTVLKTALALAMDIAKESNNSKQQNENSTKRTFENVMEIDETSDSDVEKSPTLFDEDFEDSEAQFSFDVGFERKSWNSEEDSQKQNQEFTDIKNQKEICLLAQIHNNMAVFLIAEDQLNEAEHHLKLAAVCDPENLDVVYNICLLEIKYEKSHSAKATWKNAKEKIPLLKKILSCSDTFEIPWNYSVSMEQIKTLDLYFCEMEDEDLQFDFDISWEDI